MRLKYKLGLAITVIAIAICLMTYQSYALWVATLSGGENIVEVGCFSVEYKELSSPISLNNTYPVSDAKGLSGTPYTFKIKNTCTISASYLVTLNTLTTNTITKDKIKFAISETTPTSGTNLGSYATTENINSDRASLNITDLDESIIIARGSLKEGEEVTYNTYLWLDQTAGNEVMNRTFKASINVISSPITIQEPTAVEKIRELATTDTTNLAYDGTTDNNLRYIGANPNNYVTFNNEPWRIIGVMNNIDDGTGRKESRLKIMKATQYGSGLAWDDDSNDWSNATLQLELNSTYLNSFSEEASQMVKNAVWNLGGVDLTYEEASRSESLTTLKFYEKERGADVYTGNATSWTGKVALFYASDYGYAAGGDATNDRNTCLQQSFESSSYPCYETNWLYHHLKANTSETPFSWTLTTTSSGVYKANFSESSGYVTTGNVPSSSPAATMYATFPTLYLSSNVKISGGNGSTETPYTLTLN